MSAILFVLCGLSIIYVSIIGSFIIGWSKIKSYKKGTMCPFEFKISVIIPYRNEERNILNLINSLNEQTLEAPCFEVILVNDHSGDSSTEIIQHHTNNFPNFKNIDLKEKSGKKEAIQVGIENASGDLIITTDADCTHHSQWLETIRCYYLEFKPDLIVGPVIMKSNTFFEDYQSLDFLSLIASTAGAIGINKPIMCNGANLAFPKKEFSANIDKTHISSGDDVFLLHDIKQRKGKICFLKSKEALAITNAEKSFQKFVEQRIRWASKSTSYSDKDTIFVALTVLLLNSTTLFSLILAISFDHHMWYGLFVSILLKWLFDCVLLYKTSTYFNQSQLLLKFVPTEILNVFMIPFLAIAGMFLKTKWKGRKINS